MNSIKSAVRLMNSNKNKFNSKMSVRLRFVYFTEIENFLLKIFR